MPAVNLRLTDSQHAELVNAAKASRRSLQGEIIFRLFDRMPTHSGAGEMIQADAVDRGVEARTLDAKLTKAAGDPGVDAGATESARVEPPAASVSSQPRRRMYACPHYVPPTRVCSICDV